MISSKHEADAGFQHSLWAATSQADRTWPLYAGAGKTDVAIVGAGYTGLSTAIRLADRGVGAVLLEAREPGWGASGRNNGGCVPDLVGLAGDLRARYGDGNAAKIQRFVDQSVEVVRELVGRLDDPCDLTLNGFLDLVHASDSSDKLRKRYDSLKKRGLSAHWLSASESSEYSGSPHYKYGGYLLEGAGYIHPLKFARALARAADKQCVSIYAHSPVIRLRPSTNGWELKTADGILTARQVVLAQNGYSDELWPGLTRATIRMQPWLAATQSLDDETFKSIIPGDTLLGDSHPGPYFFRKAPGNRLTIAIMKGLSIFGGRPALEQTREVLRRIFPQIGDVKLEYVWQGVATLQPGELPKLVSLADGLWAAFGYGRGVTLANATGNLLADACTGTTEGLALPVSRLSAVRFGRALENLLPAILSAVNLGK